METQGHKLTEFNKKKTISVKIRQLVIKITNLYDTNTIKFKLNTEYAAIYICTHVARSS